MSAFFGANRFKFGVFGLNCSGGMTPSIAPDLTFLIDNNPVCETGKIPHDSKWHTFRISFTAQPGFTDRPVRIGMTGRSVSIWKDSASWDERRSSASSQQSDGSV